MKIIAARITDQPRPLPEGLSDEMPWVIATLEDGSEEKLFWYYPDELTFTPKEFIGLTIEQGRRLKFTKDRDYLRS